MSLLRRDGFLIRRSGKFVTTNDPASCLCCGGTPCECCEGAQATNGWRLTVAGVVAKPGVPCADCGNWNGVFDLEDKDAGPCYSYMLDIGPGNGICGVHPAIAIVPVCSDFPYFEVFFYYDITSSPTSPTASFTFFPDKPWPYLLDCNLPMEFEFSTDFGDFFYPSPCDFSGATVIAEPL